MIFKLNRKVKFFVRSGKMARNSKSKAIQNKLSTLSTQLSVKCSLVLLEIVHVDEWRNKKCLSTLHPMCVLESWMKKGIGLNSLEGGKWYKVFKQYSKAYLTLPNLTLPKLRMFFNSRFKTQKSDFQITVLSDNVK